MSIYHKAQCVLHRPFLNRARDNPRYIPSRRACIESSLELLKYQVMQHAESRPGGLLQGRQWYNSSLSSHDFLLAGTILAVDLFHDLQIRASGRDPATSYGWGLNRHEESIAALQRSRDIWNELKDKSIEAWKASVIIGLLLGKLGQEPKDRQPYDTQDEKQNAALTLGLLSSGMNPVGLLSPPPQCPDSMKIDNNTSQHNAVPVDQTPGPGPTSPFSLFGQMPDMQTFNLDWVGLTIFNQNGRRIVTNMLPGRLGQLHSVWWTRPRQSKLACSRPSTTSASSTIANAPKNEHCGATGVSARDLAAEHIFAQWCTPWWWDRA